MSKVILNDTTMTAIGNAIRAKTGGTDLILPSAMPDAISSIQGSNGTIQQGVSRPFPNNYALLTSTTINDTTTQLYWNTEVKFNLTPYVGKDNKDFVLVLWKCSKDSSNKYITSYYPVYLMGLNTDLVPLFKEVGEANGMSYMGAYDTPEKRALIFFQPQASSISCNYTDNADTNIRTIFKTARSALKKVFKDANLTQSNSSELMQNPNVTWTDAERSISYRLNMLTADTTTTGRVKYFSALLPYALLFYNT